MRRFPVVPAAGSHLAAALLFVFIATAAAAEDAGSAVELVRAWRTHDAAPLRAPLTGRVAGVETVRDDDGSPLYHAVQLEPGGWVLVTAEEAVEPILAFSARGRYVADDANPVHALARRDAAERTRAVRLRRGAGGGLPERARRARARRRRLREGGAVLRDDDGFVATGIGSVSDVRVAPLVETHWNQKNDGGQSCYNFFTPRILADGELRWDEGRTDNYYVGCVATAMAQLMRYFAYPATPVYTPRSVTIKRMSGSSTEYSLNDIQIVPVLAGDYDYGLMPADPGGSTPEPERRMIGALCRDAAVAVESEFTNAGTGAVLIRYSRWSSIPSAGLTLETVFRYESVIEASDYGADLSPGLAEMVNPNLDAKMPVILGVARGDAGHAVLADGYGYHGGTLYHHLNMGWGSYHDAWYNLPTIDSSPSYDTIIGCIHNIYPSGSGEIVSGRVLDETGAGLAGATVSWSGVGSDTTDDPAGKRADGVFAIVHCPTNASGTLTASHPLYTFEPRPVQTGRSRDCQGTVTGNVWGLEFVGTPIPLPDLVVTALASAPLDVEEGMSLTVSVTVENSGEAAAGASAVGLWLDRTDAPGAGDAPDMTATVPALAAGASETVELVLAAPAAGAYTAWAFADADGSVQESDEANNAGPAGGYAWVVLAPLVGDLNGDDRVDLLDFYVLRSAFGTSDPVADLDGSGMVDLLDFYILRSHFGESR
jgi:hypothetical protein